MTRSVDFDHYFGDGVTLDDDVHVVVIERYDGEWTACTETWPETEDVNGSYTEHTLGFLKYHTSFRRELERQGFVMHEFATLPLEEMKYITYNILPVEWHDGVEVYGARVTVYIKS